MGIRKIIIAAGIALLMATGAAWAGDKINVNTASAEQLQSVKGIGKKMAAAIIAYREAHGAFRNIDELRHL